jgi:hypothetical protein
LACAIHTDVAESVVILEDGTEVVQMVKSDFVLQEFPLGKKAGDDRWQALMTCVGESGE